MRRRLLFLGIALAAGSTLAQQYRWMDEKGRVHYSDTPPPPSARSAQKKNFKGNAVGVQESYELTQALKSAPVTLYSHPNCKEACQLARDVLNRRGVPFTEISATDEAKMAEVKRLTGASAVPVLVVGGLVEKNPSERAYEQALDIAGYPPAGTAKPRSQRPPSEDKQPDR